MSDVSFSQAANAYQSALKSAERILQSTTLPQNKQEAAPAGQPSFGELVGDAMRGARDNAYKSEAVSAAGLAGKADIAEVVTAVSNAELALNTVVSIRDRVINAYQDIIKMPI